MPMVVVYRVSAFTAMCARILINVPFYSMVNLLAGHSAVPELIQSDFTADRLAFQLQLLMDNGKTRSKMIDDLQKVRLRLGKGGAIGRAADAITCHLEASRHP